MSMRSRWRRQRVRDLIVHHASGPSPTCEERNVRDDEEWGILKTTAVTWRGWNATAHKVPPREFWGNRAIEVRSGDVLITKAGPRDRCGVTVYVPDTPPRLMVSGKMVLLRPDPAKTNAVFLASALATPAAQQFLDARTTGLADAQLNFTNQLLLDVDLELPELDVQERIAAIRTTVDEAIEQTEALIAKTQQIKAGLMHDLFTRGVTADGQLRPPREEAPQLYKESPLGWIPKEWSLRRLDDLTTRIGDGIHTTPVYAGTHTGIYFINGNNLDSGRIVTSEVTPCVSAAEHQKHFIGLTTNSILYSINGTIGNIAQYRGEKVVLGKSAAYINCSGEVLAPYVFYYLQTAEVDRFYALEMTGSTINNLSLKSIRQTPVKVPTDTEEQARIVERLDAVTQKMEIEQSNRTKLIRTRAGLMHDLLTGAVSVEMADSQSSAQEVVANV